MENKDYKTAPVDRERDLRIGGRSRNSQVIIGGFIILIGILILLDRMGFPIPRWLFSWEMILIGVGIIMGIKSGFRDVSWVVPIIIGTIFISRDIFPHFHLGKLIWPIGIIAIGLIFVLKGKKGHSFDGNFFNPGNNYGVDSSKENFVSGFQRIDQPESDGSGAGISQPEPKAAINQGFDDEIECTAVFGGVKRTVVSKNFRGGEIVAVFGGAEIDLTHADINGIVKLEATNILGGTKLIVPPTWDVQSEMVAIFGGVEDKRRIQPELINRNKRLVLYGTAFLGGLEIKSF